MKVREAKRDGYSFQVAGINLLKVSKKIFNPTTRRNNKKSLGEFHLTPLVSTAGYGKKIKKLSEMKWFVTCIVPEDLQTTKRVTIEIGEVTLKDLKTKEVKSPYQLDLAEMFFKK